mmetsp:Transcript_455/g.577  ORF Transcript_455/g.577 Transcript_455/m.577 type:complete len:167 (+) Transcript_455:157-657(+)
MRKIDNDESTAGSAPPSVVSDLRSKRKREEKYSSEQAIEFDTAISLVTSVKKRFANQPSTYKKFLEILDTYQKGQHGSIEVLKQVSDLFSEHPDLFTEFTLFLPDGVGICPICFEAKNNIQLIPHQKAKGDVSGHRMCADCTNQYKKRKCPFCNEVFIKKRRIRML